MAVPGLTIYGLSLLGETPMGWMTGGAVPSADSVTKGDAVFVPAEMIDKLISTGEWWPGILVDLVVDRKVSPPPSEWPAEWLILVDRNKD